MNAFGFNLSFDLPDAALHEVVTGAGRILSETGVQCASPGARRLLASLKGCERKTDRVTFSTALVEEQLDLIRRSSRPPAPQHTLVQGSCWTCLNIADVGEGRVRPGTIQDLSRAVRLYEAMGIRGGGPPVMVSEVPVQHQDLLACKICIEHSESFGMPTGMLKDAEIPIFVDLFQAAGRGPVPVLAMTIVSPLRYDHMVLDFCMQHGANPGLCLHPTAGMPCMGSTSPVQLPAALILTLAEALAASFFVRAWRGEIWLPHLRSDPFDFRYANYVVGSSPYALLDAATRRLFEYLTGYRSQGGALLSLARWPDAQAVHDHVLSATLQALQGARHFSGSGQLSHDEVFSPEILVIDRDILRSVESLVRGLTWDGDLDRALEALREGIGMGQFLEHKSTLENFRRLVVEEDLFHGMNLGQWRNAGARSLIEEARILADRLVSEREFSLPEGTAKELDRIYRQAVQGRQG